MSFDGGVVLVSSTAVRLDDALVHTVNTDAGLAEIIDPKVQEELLRRCYLGGEPGRSRR